MTTPAAAATTVNTGPASTDPAVSNTGNPIPADQPNKPAAQTPEQIAEAAKKAEADKAAADKQAADEAAAKEIEASWEYSGNESVDAAVDLMKNSGLKGDDAKLIFGNALETGDLSIVNVEQLEKRIGKKTATAVMALAKAAVDAGKAQTAKIVAEAAKVAGGEKEYFELVKWAKAKEKVDPAFKKVVDTALAKAMTSGEAEAIYKKWFTQPIPPKGLNLNMPLSNDMKAAFKALGGVDVVYDAVGGPAFDATLSACRPEGRLLAIGFASGQVPQVPANLLLVKNLSVMGLYWGGYQKFAPQVLRSSLKTLLQWYGEGGLRPHISHILPFAELPQALALLRDRKSTGKVVVQVQD